MKLVITGTAPSKKNSRIINRATGKSFPSKRYTDWNKQAISELTEQFSGYMVTNYPIELTVVFYNGDMLRHDIDNALSSVLDTLQDAGVIEDDSQKHISCITVSYGGLERENPRTEIFIEE